MELKLQSPIQLGDLATKIDVELLCHDDNAKQAVITHLAPIDTAGAGSVSFLAHTSYTKFLPTTNASAVILAPADAAACPVSALVSKNPRLALANLLNLCAAPMSGLGNIHPTAVLGNNVTLGKNITIGPYCVIGDDCAIGDNTVLMPHVTLYARTTLGTNCIIHSGAVLGSDGFGYAPDAVGNWIKMQHLGGLVIGNHVEIGSNTTIDRGMIENTVIGNHVIIDNLVQIGHNVIIGNNTAIAGCVGIAGSTVIGKYCLIGGAACIAGHITICDKVHISGTTAVSHSISEPGIYSSGLPARENRAWRRSVARFNNIDDMAKRIRYLEKAIKSESQ
ncbi:MAG TPA: UDP-3-O-(3-hydroxymyristoyl)glucosamine N-acyltransferase [Gammaproteobacteria bacterium]|nr:UDP-3-O-(3-hydroxymyristoyl)glucosamine N-acyltransferase [Gammaproteobacteria bacterium]